MEYSAGKPMMALRPSLRGYGVLLVILVAAAAPTGSGKASGEASLKSGLGEGRASQLGGSGSGSSIDGGSALELLTRRVEAAEAAWRRRDDDAQQELRQLRARVQVLEERAAAARAAAACASGPAFPTLVDGARFEYSGCTRNVVRYANTSTEMCQQGAVMVYDTASTNETGLFSMWVDSHNVVHAHDTYHFVCTITRDAPLLATCTLTFEEPARPEGPALVQLRFNEAEPPLCEPQAVTVVGSYFFGGATNDSGTYSFYGRRV